MGTRTKIETCIKCHDPITLDEPMFIIMDSNEKTLGVYCCTCCRKLGGLPEQASTGLCILDDMAIDQTITEIFSQTGV